MTVFSYLGWWVGEQFGGFVTAIVVSSISSIAGIVIGWKISRMYFT